MEYARGMLSKLISRLNLTINFIVPWCGIIVLVMTVLLVITVWIEFLGLDPKKKAN